MREASSYIGKKAVAVNWEHVRNTLTNAGFDNTDTKEALTITNAKYFNLGKGCENTIMFQFNDVPIWFIGAHFKGATNE